MVYNIYVINVYLESSAHWVSNICISARQMASNKHQLASFPVKSIFVCTEIMIKRFLFNSQH